MKTHESFLKALMFQKPKRFAKDRRLIEQSNLFDTNWYIESYKDVRDSGVDPIVHYLEFGAAESKDPSPHFNTTLYLGTHHDVAEDGANPLVHYILFGRREGRKIFPSQGISTDESPITNLTTIQMDSRDLLDNPFHSSKHLLIIAELGLNQCTKYRVLQTRELFEKCGFSVEISAHQDLSRSMNLLQRTSMVLFYRVPEGDNFIKYIDTCTRQNIAVGYDIDDPMFDINALRNNHNLASVDKDSVNNILSDAKKFLAAINLSDFCIASTPRLKELLQERGYRNNIILRRNLVDNETLHISNKLLSTHKENQDDIVRLIYATPSKAHNADFRLLKDVLPHILRKYNGKVRLVLMGELDTGSFLDGVSKYTDTLQAQNYREFLAVLQNMDINLVPLIDNKFNSTKSNIKLIDAAMVKVPTICSNVGDYSDNFIDGVHCFIAENTTEWRDKIELLINDPCLRSEISSKAYDFVKQTYSHDEYSHVVNDIFHEAIS